MTSKRLVLPGAVRAFFTLFLCFVSGLAWSALPELIQKTKPSIVVVGTFNKLRAPAFAMRGTGFAVGSGNLVATNAHVIPERLEENEVLLVLVRSQGNELQQRTAKLIRSDSDHDLALLRVEGPPLPALPLHNGMASEGQSVIFIGFPIGGALGFSPVTHHCIISAVTPIVLPTPSARQLNEKVIRRVKSGPFDIYQIDGTAYPGNSGGPLLNSETGEVLGIINGTFIKSTKEAVLSNPSGISFAIPVTYLRELLQGEN